MCQKKKCLTTKIGQRFPLLNYSTLQYGLEAGCRNEKTTLSVKPETAVFVQNRSCAVEQASTQLDERLRVQVAA